MPLALKNSGFNRDGPLLQSGRHSGRGLWDVVKALPQLPSRLIAAMSGSRKGAPPAVRAYLAAHQNTPITSVTVCREPIASGIRTALDVLTFGGFSAAARQLNYDSVYHLWVVLHTAAGVVRFDKNQVVEMKHSPAPSGTCMPVPLNGPLTVGQLFAGGEKMNPENFWRYSSVNNCQNFVLSLLRGSGLASSSVTQFVLQDAASLLTGTAKKIADTVTDIAARADIVHNGVGGRLGAGRRLRRR